MNEIKEIYNEYLKEKFYFATHKSGLRVIFVPKKFASFYAIYGTKYGSVDSEFMCEGEDTFTKVPDGIAHYLEHKMFEDECGEDAFAMFSKYGASANAFTTHNLTAYLFSCTSEFEHNLRALLSFVNKPYFTEQTVEKERGIISEEIEMYEDDPYSALHYGMLELLYENNPVKINVAGTVDSVREITARHLYRCYNAFYTPQNMVLSVSGDTDINTVLSVCDEILCDGKSTAKVKRAEFEEPDSVCLSRRSITRPVSQPLFCIGIKDKVCTNARERVKRSIAGAIFMDMVYGSSSDFFSELYNSGKVNSMSCGYDSMINYAFAYIIGEGKDPESVYACFESMTHDVIEQGIDVQNFNRIKKVTVSNYVKGFDNTENIATEALYMELEGVSISDYPDLIQEVDAEYVYRVACEMMADDHFCMMTVIPQ